MPEPLLEQILAKLKTKVLGVTTAAGYTYQTQRVKRVRRFLPRFIDAEYDVQHMIRLGTIFIGEETSGTVFHDAEVFIMGLKKWEVATTDEDRVEEEGLDAFQTVQARLISDIDRVIRLNYTLDSLAWNVAVTEVDTEIAVDGPWVPFIARVLIRYELANTEL